MTIPLLAQAVLILLYLVLALYFIRNVWRSLHSGYLLVFEERVERDSAPGAFWLVISLWCLMTCLFSYAIVREIVRS